MSRKRRDVKSSSSSRIIVASSTAVSYTHLDVYKRQIITDSLLYFLSELRRTNHVNTVFYFLKLILANLVFNIKLVLFYIKIVFEHANQLGAILRLGESFYRYEKVIMESR